MRDAIRGRPADWAGELGLAVGLLGMLYSVVLLGGGGPSLIPWAIGCAIAAIALGLASRARGRVSAKGRWGVGLAALGLFSLLFAGAPSGTSPQVRYAANMRQVALGLMQYADAHGRLPPAVVRDREGRPLYSWRVLVLPWIEEAKMFQKFNLDEPWDSPHNRQFIHFMPRILSSTDNDHVAGVTHIQVFAGRATLFEDPRGQAIAARDGTSLIPDGAGGTILLAEAAQGIVWTAPGDLEDRPDRPIPALGGSLPSTDDIITSVFADGSIVFLPRVMIVPALRRALSTRNGREQLPKLPGHP